MRSPARDLLLVCCVCAPLWGFVSPASAREFVELTTPGYVVVSVLGEAKTRRIALDIANFQAVIALFTNARDLTPRVPTRIYALSARDWDQYARPWQGLGGMFYTGAFANDMVLDAQSFGSDMYRIVFHEYTHYAVRNNSTYDYPAWFDEGLAEVLSTVQFTDTDVMIGKVPVDRWITIDQSAWLPFETVFAVKRSSPEYRSHKVAPAFYAQSWALMHYAIFEKPSLMKGLNAYVNALTDGRSNEEAFSQSVGIGYGELDKELKAYARQTHFKYISIKRDKLAQVASLEASMRDLTSNESALELADVVVRVGNDRSACRISISPCSRRNRTTRAPSAAWRWRSTRKSRVRRPINCWRTRWRWHRPTSCCRRPRRKSCSSACGQTRMASITMLPRQLRP